MAETPDETTVPAWCASLTPEQYAAAKRCAAEAPPLSARQRATLRAIFAAAASGTHHVIGGAA